MKNKWLVVQVKENEKFYAYIMKITENDNLFKKLKVEGIMSANIYDTKKKAEEVSRNLIELFKDNGTFIF